MRPLLEYTWTHCHHDEVKTEHRAPPLCPTYGRICVPRLVLVRILEPLVLLPEKVA